MIYIMIYHDHCSDCTSVATGREARNERHCGWLAQPAREVPVEVAVCDGRDDGLGAVVDHPCVVGLGGSSCCSCQKKES